MTGAFFARQRYRDRGTRFRLFPQSPVIADMAEPEIVWLAHSPAVIGPGPSDDRMYVVDAVGKQPYWDASHAPPYRGPRNPPVQPGPDGHFDHLTDCSSREFMAAHMYGTIRFVLDVWERYFGGPVPWHFAADYRQLELVPLAQ